MNNHFKTLFLIFFFIPKHDLFKQSDSQWDPAYYWPDDLPAELGRGPDSEYWGWGGGRPLIEPRLVGRLLESGVRGTFDWESLPWLCCEARPWLCEDCFPWLCWEVLPWLGESCGWDPLPRLETSGVRGIFGREPKAWLYSFTLKCTNIIVRLLVHWGQFMKSITRMYFQVHILSCMLYPINCIAVFKHNVYTIIQYSKINSSLQIRCFCFFLHAQLHSSTLKTIHF